jgi:ribonucleoside-diphosphate reductase alpha chain
MTPYQEYIGKSRYSRYLDDKGRREHWPETVNRYFDFMTKHLQDKHNYTLSTAMREQLQTAVTNLEVVPSMRSIMTAGDALERQNVAGYTVHTYPLMIPKPLMRLCTSSCVVLV